MAYAFDPTSGDTRANLLERVIANTFNSTRYTELVYAWLDEGVTDICRRLKLFQGAAILAVDTSTGEVTQPATPFYRVDEVWSVNDAAATTGLENVRTAAAYPLTRLTDTIRAPWLGTGSAPSGFYTVSRKAGSTRAPQLRITVHPAGMATVGIIGLQRPAAMDGDSDTSGLGADFDAALVAYCKWQAFSNEDDVQMAQFWEGRYLAAIAADAEVGLHDDGPDIAPGTWDE